MDTGTPFTPALHREGFEALRESVDPGWLFPRLQQHFDDDIGASKKSTAQQLDADARLADQYARLHRASVGGSGTPPAVGGWRGERSEARFDGVREEAPRSLAPWAGPG
jgi:hypothetical protein